ncbi:MAG: hypothetical protein ACYTKD_28055 [Planctomycetota bacterium]|jgi:hypothetical protein
MELAANTCSVRIVDEATYTRGSADNLRQYELEYGSLEEFTSSHGVSSRTPDETEYCCVLLACGGPTSVHEHSAVAVGDLVCVAAGDTVFALSLPRLDLIWQLKVDEVTCFGIYYSSERRCLISHGELEIARIPLDGSVVWRGSGRDIFSEGFWLRTDCVEAEDFNHKRYRFGLDTGKCSEILAV